MTSLASGRPRQTSGLRHPAAWRVAWSPTRPGAKARARCRARWSRRWTSCSPAAPPARCRANAARRAAGTGTELAQIRPYQVGDDVRRIDAAASARTGHPHVRDYVPERTLTTWLLVDVSASMAFGTADRLKSDVADGVALVIGRLAVRRAGRVGLLTCGAPTAPPARRRAAAAPSCRAAARAGGRRRARRLRAGRGRARGRACAGSAGSPAGRA